MPAGNRVVLFSTTCAAALWLAVGAGAAQSASAPPGIALRPGAVVLNPGAPALIVRPASGFAKGPHKAHTNYEILIPRDGYPAVIENAKGAPFKGYLQQTPASLACDYGLVKASDDCNPNKVTTNPSGGSKAIAIVDAYDLATAATDLAKFDTQFGLPAANFTKIYASNGSCTTGGSAPPPNADWNGEEDLDIEWAHAMAPSAHLYLVEAADPTHLIDAEQVAAACVANAGGGQVSNSWGGSESADEHTLDSYFTGSNVVFFASTGDDTFPGWPATSPNVVAVGGTTIASNPNTGQYEGQSSWYGNPDTFGYTGGAFFSSNAYGEGAGSSAFETRPSDQDGVANVVGSTRGVPDVVAVADPYTGVWVYSPASFLNGWGVFGGTSVSSPAMAGIANLAGDFFASSNAFLSALYTAGTAKTLTQFSKMDSGNCGALPTYTTWPPATFGATIAPQYQEAQNSGILYNECGGWGSPMGKVALP